MNLTAFNAECQLLRMVETRHLTTGAGSFHLSISVF